MPQDDGTEKAVRQQTRRTKYTKSKQTKGKNEFCFRSKIISNSRRISQEKEGHKKEIE